MSEQDHTVMQADDSNRHSIKNPTPDGQTVNILRLLVVLSAVLQTAGGVR